ncbi:RNA-guided endonuclease IscB [Microcoleus vaginatus GB1-A2]|jgi:5-methylcytosine-specific restriction endonuclease McrA|uniref:RNA-guided endonuclease IscB n=1 Tax=Microcoleus vaginatus TaxID=119532 RepID=UPI0016850FCD|nr:RRXRR domain-containing protein [Microcoleus sp. FACHB-61]
MSNHVFLIDSNKTPLNPVHPAQARKLLDSEKAAVFQCYPFTLILKRVIENPNVYPLTLKIDPGSKFTGIALVTNQGNVVWAMELQHRGQQIKDALLHRRAVRRGRRNRNTRYRQARFLNRKRPDGWLAPSLRHRILTIETWVKRLQKFAPLDSIAQELVKFDTQAIQNPEISGIEYQQGTLKGYECREYLLEKWNRQCAYCGVKDVPLEIEHIQPKSQGGSDRISNLCLACHKCNQRKGNRDIKDFLKGKSDVLKRVLKQAKTTLKDAASVNSTRWALFNTLKSFGLPVSTGTGGQTKFNRIRFSLPKAHWIDAACVGVVNAIKLVTTKILKVKATGFGGRQRCQTDKFGYPQKHRPLRPILGFCTGDIVRANVPKGKYKGTFTARVCPMSHGYGEFVIDKKRRSIKLDYLTSIHRKDGYEYA